MRGQEAASMSVVSWTASIAATFTIPSKEYAAFWN